MYEQSIEQSLNQIIAGTYRQLVNDFLIDREAKDYQKTPSEIFS
jgi:hypothetical protein